MCSIAMQYAREGGSMGEKGESTRVIPRYRNSIAIQGKEGGTNTGWYQGGTYTGWYQGGGTYTGWYQGGTYTRHLLSRSVM